MSISFCDLIAKGSQLSAVLACFFGVMGLLDWSCMRHFWDRPSQSPEEYYERCKVWRTNSDRWLLDLALSLFLAMAWLGCQLARWLLGC